MSETDVNVQALPEDDFSAYEAARTAKEEPEVESGAAEVEETDAKPETTQPESDPEDDDQELGDEQPVKGRRLQKRFDKLTAEIRDLKSQLAAGKGNGSREPEAAAVEQGSAQQGDPNAKPDPLNFNTTEEYLEALTDWKVDQRERLREGQRALKERAETYNGRVNELKKQPEYADWDRVFEAIKADDIPLSAPFAAALNSDPHAAELSYWLAKNPKEAKRITSLSPIESIRELGKISARFDAAPEKTKPPVSKAPAPVRPVSSAKSSEGEKSLNDETDFTAYEKRRMAQLRRR
jgi:hypothetical protein